MAASLLGLGLLLGGSRAWAQQPPPAGPASATITQDANNGQQAPPLILKFTKEARSDTPAPATPVPPRPDAPHLTYSKDAGAPQAPAAPAVPKLMFAKDAVPLPQQAMERDSGDAPPAGPSAGSRLSFTKEVFAQDAAPPAPAARPAAPAAGWVPAPPNPSFTTDPMLQPVPMSSGPVTQAAAVVPADLLSPSVGMSAPPAALVVTAPAPVQMPPAAAPVKTTPVVQRAPAPKEKEASTRLPTEQSEEYQIQLEPPGPQRLFKLESESAFFERMRQEARQRPTPERIEFPAEPVVSTQQVFVGRYFPPMTETVEPAYVCYGRLLFEVKNFDRYGWDLGPLMPFLDAGMFYLNVATLPYHMFTDPCRKCECSAGYCLPGDPVPFLLYPPGLSVTGLLAEAGAVVAIPFLLP